MTDEQQSSQPSQLCPWTPFFFETEVEGDWTWRNDQGAYGLQVESGAEREGGRRGDFDKVLVDAECTHDG
jgi:hypothetical protein